MEYSDYNNVFSVKNTAKLPKSTRINEYAIKLKKNKQQFFRFIYSLRLVKLKTLKIYIKTNLINNFIWFFKSPAKALILFDRKLDKNLRFYIDNWVFNNLIIKNRHLLLLINKSLNQLG